MSHNDPSVTKVWDLSRFFQEPFSDSGKLQLRTLPRFSATLGITSHLVSLLHHVGSWCKAASFQEGLSKVTCSWKLPNSTLCLSWRYDCYSADNGLCAAGAKTEIDVLAIQRTSTDTSINRLSDSSLHGCFDGTFPNRTESQQCDNELFGKSNGLSKKSEPCERITQFTVGLPECSCLRERPVASSCWEMC